VYVDMGHSVTLALFSVPARAPVVFFFKVEKKKTHRLSDLRDDYLIVMGGGGGGGGGEGAKSIQMSAVRFFLMCVGRGGPGWS